MKLLALGDLHLDAGADLGRKPGDRLAEQESVWAWSLQQARELGVDAVLFAGDAFQHRKPSVEALLAFERPLVEHQNAGGPRVLAIPGNHDVSSLDGDCALDVFHEAGLIELVRDPRVVRVGPTPTHGRHCLCSACRQEDWTKITSPCGMHGPDCPAVYAPMQQARVCCLPWASTARLAANYDGPRDLLNEHAASLLVDVARDLYSQAAEPDGVQRASVVAREPVGETLVRRPAPGSPIILLTHFAITGTSLPSGLDVGQFGHEPVLPQDELLAIGYDAVIAGHIHRPALFGMRGMYVGSPMPLNFGESDGCTRGPWLIDFDGVMLGQGEPRPLPTIAQLPAPSRRFLNIEGDEVFEGHDVEGAYVKLHARDGADGSALREGLLGMGAYRVFVETHVERATRARDASVDDSLDEREALARWLTAQNLAPDLHARVFERAVGYLDRVAAGDIDPERAASARPEPTVSDRQAATPEPAVPEFA